jgi:mono/diheme cytochrome c family protein
MCPSFVFLLKKAVNMRLFAFAATLTAALWLGASRGTAVADDQPVAGEPPSALAVQGKKLFTQLCSHCHGVDMVNPGNVSFDLRKFPHDDKARFVNSVTHGKNAMPPWGDILHPDEIEALWAYIQTGGKM